MNQVVMLVEVWQWMTKKFSILFNFIIENLTGMKVFIPWQPGYHGCPQESGSRKPFQVIWLLASRPWDSKFRKPLGFWFHSQNCPWVEAQLTEITRENQAGLADHRETISHMCEEYTSAVCSLGIFVCFICPYRPCTQSPWIYHVNSFVHCNCALHCKCQNLQPSSVVWFKWV